MKFRVFYRYFKPWLLMKISVFIVHLLLTMVLFSTVGSAGIFSFFLLPFVVGVVNSAFFVLAVTFLASIIYMILHKEVLGRRISFLTSLQVVVVPSIIMYLSGVSQLFIGLFIDYIVFAFIYQAVKGVRV